MALWLAVPDSHGVNASTLQACQCACVVYVSVRVQVGDGTTTVVILSGELLRAAKPFVEEGVHPRVSAKAGAVSDCASLASQEPDMNMITRASSAPHLYSTVKSVPQVYQVHTQLWRVRLSGKSIKLEHSSTHLYHTAQLFNLVHQAAPGWVRVVIANPHPTPHSTPPSTPLPEHHRQLPPGMCAGCVQGEGAVCQPGGQGGGGEAGAAGQVCSNKPQLKAGEGQGLTAAGQCWAMISTCKPSSIDQGTQIPLT